MSSELKHTNSNGWNTTNNSNKNNTTININNTQQEQYSDLLKRYSVFIRITVNDHSMLAQTLWSKMLFYVLDELEKYQASIGGYEKVIEEDLQQYFREMKGDLTSVLWKYAKELAKNLYGIEDYNLRAKNLDNFKCEVGLVKDQNRPTKITVSGGNFIREYKRR